MQPVFYYDLADPWCYLAAEQITAALGGLAEWEPVLAIDAAGRVAPQDRPEIEARARELGLQPLRWPRQWPPDSRPAMLAATYAKQIGRGVTFSLAAFRQAFAAGQDLGSTQTVLIAAASCEIHPNAVLKGVGLKSVNDALGAAGERAVAKGVSQLPAIRIGGLFFQGPDAVSDAEGAAL